MARGLYIHGVARFVTLSSFPSEDMKKGLGPSTVLVSGELKLDTFSFCESR